MVVFKYNKNEPKYSKTSLLDIDRLLSSISIYQYLFTDRYYEILVYLYTMAYLEV